MEKMREMGSVMKGRDDGMESKMGCGVRETSGGKRMEGDGAGDGEPGVCVQIWEEDRGL